MDIRLRNPFGRQLRRLDIAINQGNRQQVGEAVVGVLLCVDVCLRTKASAAGEVIGVLDHVGFLSVVSSGTLHPFRNRLSMLNQPIISTSLREIVSPYWSISSRKVSSRSVPLFDNSSVALHTRTYSGLIPDTGPSVAAASISVAERPAFLAITTLARLVRRIQHLSRTQDDHLAYPEINTFRLEHCMDYTDRRLVQVVRSGEHLQDVQGPYRIIGFAHNLLDDLLGGQRYRDGGSIGRR